MLIKDIYYTVMYTVYKYYILKPSQYTVAFHRSCKNLLEELNIYLSCLSVCGMLDIPSRRPGYIFVLFFFFLVK